MSLLTIIHLCFDLVKRENEKKQYKYTKNVYETKKTVVKEVKERCLCFNNKKKLLVFLEVVTYNVWDVWAVSE